MRSYAEIGNAAQEAMKAASRLIPDTSFRTLDVEKATTSMLHGKWECIPQGGGYTYNRRKRAQLETHEDESPEFYVLKDSYTDFVFGDRIAEMNKLSGVVESASTLFGKTTDELLWEIMRNCEGFGLILPTQLPQVIENIGSDPNLASLVSNWKSEGSIGSSIA